MPDTPNPGGRSLSPKSLAAKLDLTERNAHSIIERGIIPSYRIGKLLRVRETDVDAYLLKLLRRRRYRPRSLQRSKSWKPSAVRP